MKRRLTSDEALLAMAGLCARSEQCADDIIKKLRNRGFGYSESAVIVSELMDRNFIDHKRFARSFAHDKVKFSAWGKLKIRAALAAKRISSGDITEGLSSIEESDYSAAVERAALSKAKTLDLSLYEDRLKLYRHLLSRGFESSVASCEIKKLAKN